MQAWHTPQLTDLGSISDAQNGGGLVGDGVVLGSTVAP